jgi:hypothetical protein
MAGGRESGPPHRTGTDPVAFVVSLNLRRRHLTDGQKAALALEISNYTHGGVRRGVQVAPGDLNLPRHDLAPHFTHKLRPPLWSALPNGQFSA